MEQYGKNPNTLFRAFGDDSAYKNILVYAYAIFHRQNVAKAKKLLIKLRKKHSIPKDFAIHCRIMFSGHQRRKKGIPHVSIEQVKTFVSTLIEELNNVPCFLRYAYCEIPDTGKIFLDVHNGDESKVHESHKGILSILSGACFTPTRDRVQPPGIEQCEIYASPDATRIKFIGRNRHQAEKYLSTMAFEDRKNQTKKHLRPHVKSHVLHQVADVYAYICSHAISDRCEDKYFKVQLSKVKYYTRVMGIPDSRFEEFGIGKK